MKICLMTDLHMNRYPEFMNKSLLSKARNSDMLLLLGDITTGLHTEKHLNLLSKYCKDVRFVLGNHDYYTSSFQETEVRVRRFCENTNLRWLVDESPEEISPGIWLVGVDGWYDGVHGDAFFMDVNFDRMMIKDLLIKRQLDERAEVISKRAEESASLFVEKMEKIPSAAKHIIVATHYPPWMGPILSILDAFWLPKSVNSVLANKILEEAALRGSEVRFDVFCGHVHSAYNVQPAENVYCTVFQSRTAHSFEL